MLDRIDLFVGVPRLSSAEIGSRKRGDATKDILNRVIRARTIQYERFGTWEKTNASLSGKDLAGLDFSKEAASVALESVDRL